MSQFHSSEPQLYGLYSELSEFEENPATINEPLENRDRLETVLHKLIDSFSISNNGRGELDKNSIRKRSNNNAAPSNTTRLVTNTQSASASNSSRLESDENKVTEGNENAAYGPMEGVQIIKAIGTIYEPESGSDWMIPNGKDGEGSVIVSTGSLIDFTRENGTTTFPSNSELNTDDVAPQYLPPETSAKIEQLNDGDGKSNKIGNKWTTWNEKPSSAKNTNKETSTNTDEGSWSNKVKSGSNRGDRLTSSSGGSKSDGNRNSQRERQTSSKGSRGNRGHHRHTNSERVTNGGSRNNNNNNNNANGNSKSEKLTNGHSNGNGNGNGNGNVYSAKVTSTNSGIIWGNSGTRSEKQSNGNAGESWSNGNGASWNNGIGNGKSEKLTNGWGSSNAAGQSQRQTNSNGGNGQKQTNSNGYSYPDRQPSTNGNTNGNKNGNGNGSAEKPSNNGNGRGYPDRQNGSPERQTNRGNRNGHAERQTNGNGGGASYPEKLTNGNGGSRTGSKIERQITKPDKSETSHTGANFVTESTASVKIQRMAPSVSTVPQNQNTIRNLLFSNPNNVQIETKSNEGVGPGISDIFLQSNFIGSSSNMVSSISSPFDNDNTVAGTGTQQPMFVNTNKVDTEIIVSNQVPYIAVGEDAPFVSYSLHSGTEQNSSSETILPPSSAIYSYDAR